MVRMLSVLNLAATFIYFYRTRGTLVLSFGMLEAEAFLWDQSITLFPILNSI